MASKPSIPEPSRTNEDGSGTEGTVLRSVMTKVELNEVKVPGLRKEPAGKSNPPCERPSLYAAQASPAKLIPKQLPEAAELQANPVTRGLILSVKHGTKMVEPQEKTTPEGGRLAAVIVNSRSTPLKRSKAGIVKW